MTKTEFLNDLIYDMAGYLDTSGVDRLKNAVAYRLKGFQLTSDETLPATDVRDNEWILGRYHVDLIAVGRKEKTIGMYLYTLRKFFNETGLHYASMTGQDIMDYIAIRQYRDKISKAYAGWITNGVRTVQHGKCLGMISNHQKDGEYMDGVRKPSKEARELPIA